MKRSGWRKRNGANRKSQLKSARILLIILLSIVFLCVFPEFVSASKTDKTERISVLMKSVPISSVCVQNKKHNLPGEGNMSTDDIAEPTDQKIRQKIIEEIKNDPFILSKDITVIVENGVVTLKGSVANVAERAAASADAFQCGARGVRNLLRIRESPDSRALDRVFYDTRLGRYRLKVRSNMVAF